jgi:hypothetical protein
VNEMDTDWLAIRLLEETRMDMNDLPLADVDNNEDLWRKRK